MIQIKHVIIYILLINTIVNPINSQTLKTEIWSSGKKKGEGYIINNNIKHGKWTYWYENGEKWAEGEYNNDSTNGKWTYWYPQKKFKEKEGNFINGKKDGKWIEYHPNGNISAETF